MRRHLGGQRQVAALRRPRSGQSRWVPFQRAALCPRKASSCREVGPGTASCAAELRGDEAQALLLSAPPLGEKTQRGPTEEPSADTCAREITGCPRLSRFNMRLASARGESGVGERQKGTAPSSRAYVPVTLMAVS